MMAGIGPDAVIDAVGMEAQGSIRTLGFTVPVATDTDNVLIDGHAVLEATKALSYQTIPVVRLEHLNAAERRAYRIAVNKLSEQSTWDKAALRIEIAELLPS